MKICFFLLLIFFVFSCKQETKRIPKGIIDKTSMQELLWDMTRADAFLANYGGKNDTAFNRLKETATLYRQVFQIHRTSREEFKKSLEWYQQHPVLMKAMLDSLQNRRNKIMQERSKPSTTIDTLRS